MIHERPRFQGLPNNGLPPPERGGSQFHATITRPPERGRTPTPTLPREAPLPEALEKAIFEDSRRTDERPKKPNRIKVFASRVILAGIVLTGVGLGINKIRGDDEPTPQTSSADVPRSPTDSNRLVPRAEAETKIVPPVIDPKNPDKINMLFPIEPAPGSENRKIKVERDVDWMGGGIRNIIDSEQSVKKMSSVIKNAFIIKDGLKDGDIIKAPLSGTISSGGTIKGEDELGNPYTIMMGGHFKLEFIKEIPPSRTEKVGPGEYRVTESHVPVEQGEPIAIIRNPSKGIIGPGGGGGTGQMYVYAFSTVAIEDGIKQQGAADIVMNNLPHNLKVESSN